jgi:AraC family transcriptional regulator of arabinose operon
MTRARGNTEYMLLHFYNALDISINQKPVHVLPNAVIVLSPQTAYAHLSAESYRLDWMCMVGNLPETMRVYGLAPDILYQPANSAGKITGIIENLEFEFYARHFWWYRYVDIKVEELFMLISSSISQVPAVSPEVSLIHRFQSLHLEMSAFPERDWCVKNIASRIGICESRVYVVYRSLYGTSPAQDIISMCIEKAKTLFKQGFSISETSECCGYNNVSHFIRQFRQQEGLSPLKYIQFRRQEEGTRQ